MDHIHLALQQLQRLHDQLIGRSVLVAADRVLLKQLANDALPELGRLAALNMPDPWYRQVRASRELVEMAVAEATQSAPQWPKLLAALNAALYPWAHLPESVTKTAQSASPRRSDQALRPTSPQERHVEPGRAFLSGADK